MNPHRRSVSDLRINYSGIFYLKIKEHFDAGKYTDVNIICLDEVEFKCHRVVLAAVSRYFDKMFGGNFKESRCASIILHDCDGSTFNEVLQFAYTGNIPTINDRNVFGLLRASDFLELDVIEKWCVRYLLERRIPMNCGLEIYLYACAMGKKELIEAVSRVILKHISQFARDSLFLSIPYDDMIKLLSNCRNSCYSPDNIQIFLDAVFKWICLTGPTRSAIMSLYPYIWSIDKHFAVYFLNYFHEIPEKCSPKNVENIMDDSEGSVEYVDEDTRMNMLAAFDENFKDDCNDLSLYVCVKTQKMTLPFSCGGSIFTSRGSNDDVNSDWFYHLKVEPVIEYMRTVTMNKRLYCLKSRKVTHDSYNRGETFGVCSSISELTSSLSTGMQLLTRPFDSSIRIVDDPSCRMCCDANNIFVSCPNVIPPPGILVYNSDVDDWSPVSIFGEESYKIITMTCHDGRLYMLGNKNELRAYDFREGKLAPLASSHQLHYVLDECCCHKGKIYVSNYNNYKETDFPIELFDPTAGKWNVLTSKPKKNVESTVRPYRLMSFDNRLWMFSCDDDRAVQYVDIYDSYLRNWETSNTLTNAIDEIYPSRILEEERVVKIVTDVIIF